MNKISAVVITKNEEEKIEACLNSLHDFVDEIVIVDDFSNDRTIDICRKFNANVIVNKSNGNFDNQRNIGIENAHSEWILQMDADEVVPSETAKRIRTAIDNPGRFAAFQLRRRNFLLGKPLKYGGSYDYMTKLFRKDKACYVGNSVHETLSIDGDIGKIDTEIYHYNFQTISAIFEKSLFYAEEEATWFVKEKNEVLYREIKYRLTWKSLKLFWKIYIKKAGYKDGMYGLVWSIVNVIGPQIKWLKIWEKALKEGKLK